MARGTPSLTKRIPKQRHTLRDKTLCAALPNKRLLAMLWVHPWVHWRSRRQQSQRRAAQPFMAPHPPFHVQTLFRLTTRDHATPKMPRLGSDVSPPPLPLPVRPHSQHTEAVDPRDALTVPQQVAAVSACRQKQLLPGLTADAPVVDGQRLHGRAGSPCASAGSPCASASSFAARSPPLRQPGGRCKQDVFTLLQPLH